MRERRHNTSAGKDIGAAATELVPPVAIRRPVTTVHHGIARTDDYAWLAPTTGSR